MQPDDGEGALAAGASRQRHREIVGEVLRLKQRGAAGGYNATMRKDTTINQGIAESLRRMPRGGTSR